ncbi:hypothetical protein EPR50_G00096540 [Perca flavescens]|uniref:Uncharacterized protein n=1 Tax=Perca flavescens TaxID=8167 RepID=A0A484CZC1_PERFV|nr:hypothetical protein EPR50_G00096540 [Perca flavescens]
MCGFLKAWQEICKCSLFSFCFCVLFCVFLLPLGLILICAVCVFCFFPGVSCPGESALHSIGTALIVYCIYIFKPTNSQIYQSFPVLCVIPI